MLQSEATGSKNMVGLMFQRYTVCMNLKYLGFPLLFLNLLAVQATAAEDAVLPPPQVQQSAAVSAPQRAGDVQESAPNLRDELSKPDGNASADVRSYKREDGSTVTEYAFRGRVYKVKVQPAGGLPAYYLYDRDGNGVFEQRLPGGAKRNSIPSWVLQEF